MNEIKPSDVVTIELNPNSTSANVCIVDSVSDNEALLFHPLYPGCFIKRPLADLNNAPVRMKDPNEKCLHYIKHNEAMLSYVKRQELDALCVNFVVRRELTPKQLQTMADLCGDIARINLHNNMDAAVHSVVQNQGLLDAFNQRWFNDKDFKPIFQRRRTPTKKQFPILFRMAGFVLAQLEPQVANPGVINESQSKETSS